MSSESKVARLSCEGPRSLVEAIAHVKGTKVSYRTALRWALHGIQGVRLESFKVGGRRLTSIAAVQRFVASMDAPRSPEPQGDATSAQHRRDAADDVLSSFGLGREQEGV